MIHRVDVERYRGSMGDLAEDVGNLRYDALAEFLRLLAAKLSADAAGDEGRGRRWLAAELRGVAGHVSDAAARGSGRGAFASRTCDDGLAVRPYSPGPAAGH